ncbi:MAG TPA: biopolymer transporter ExbD [Gemmatimonadaceae bacterium]|nr:biopolymer transporter ExbD [Gemmatimonadaceae bacterium]
MKVDRLAVSVSEMNVTPMLDVLLVLLVMFMVMSIRLHRTVDASLPVPCTGACGASAQIVLEVLPGPVYKINRVIVPTAALGDTIASIYASRPEKIMQVAGYPGVQYQDVVSAMDIARGAGVTVLGIAPRESYLKK